MLPNLDKLQAKCKLLGLEVTQSGKRPSKDDYVKALHAHYLKNDPDFPGGLPYKELDPVLCYPIWDMKPEEEAKVWKSPSWVGQQKFNGFRLIIHFVKGVGVFAHSRNVSVKNFRFDEKRDMLVWHDFVPDFSASVDTEAIIEKPVDTRPYTAKGQVTKTSLHSATAAAALEPSMARKLQQDQDAPFHFKLFDIVYFQGKDLKALPLVQRDDYRLAFVGLLKDRHPQIAQYFENSSYCGYTEAEKRECFRKGTKELGWEGLILKNLNAPYAEGKRSKDIMVKVKKRREYDAFVSGFIRGNKETGFENLVGAIEFSVHTDKGDHMLACCTNVTLESRKKITVYDVATDTVKMIPEMYGRVAQVSGQDISARVLRLSHATIDRWRYKDGPDHKDEKDCYLTMQELEDASEWVG